MTSDQLRTEIDHLLDQAPEEDVEAVLALLKERASTREQALAASRVELSDADCESLEKLLDDEEHGYNAWISFLAGKGFSPETLMETDKPMPTQKEALALLTTKLTADQLEVLRDPRIFKRPKFTLVPVVSSDSLFAKDESETGVYKRRLGDIDFYVSGSSAKTMQSVDQKKGASGVNSGRIIGWELGIVDASESPNVLPEENVKAKLGKRVEWFGDTLGAKQIQRPDFNTYALLAAQAKEARRPIDNILKRGGTWTLLEGPNSDVSLVDGAHWREHEQGVEIGEFNAGDREVHARLRPQVMVRVE